MAKIRQTVEVELKPTSDDIAQMIWEMDAKEQLDLLFALMEGDSSANIYMQMDSIRNELDCCPLDDEYKDAVRHFIASLYAYVCS